MARVHGQLGPLGLRDSEIGGHRGGAGADPHDVARASSTRLARPTPAIRGLSFRVNAFRRRGSVLFHLRAIVPVKTIEGWALDHPTSPKSRAGSSGHRTTGSGKSTTLAAMIDHQLDTGPSVVTRTDRPASRQRRSSTSVRWV
jgi:hypothetical protein